MSDLDNAINSINASAAKAENTATFLDDMSTFDDQSSVTNPNNGQAVASIPKQVKDRTDELFTAAESDINQAVDDAAQSATDAQDAADSVGRYQGLWPDTGGSANKGDTYQTQVSGTGTGQYFTALQNTTVDPVGDDVNWRAVVSFSSINGENLIANASFDIAGSVTNPPDATPRSYSAVDELFQGVFAFGALTGVTYIDGKVNGTGQLYTDVYKSEKQKLSTANYVSSIADSNGLPDVSGSSFVDNGDYWRVTFNMSDTFSVKLEQGDIATRHGSQTHNGRIYTFNTLNEMKAGTTPIGGTAVVLATGAEYLIEKTGSPDGFSDHSVPSGVAVLQLKPSMRASAFGISTGLTSNDQAQQAMYNRLSSGGCNSINYDSGVYFFQCNETLSRASSATKIKDLHNVDFIGGVATTFKAKSGGSQTQGFSFVRIEENSRGLNFKGIEFDGDYSNNPSFQGQNANRSGAVLVMGWDVTLPSQDSYDDFSVGDIEFSNCRFVNIGGGVGTFRKSLNTENPSYIDNVRVYSSYFEDAQQANNSVGGDFTWGWHIKGNRFKTTIPLSDTIWTLAIDLSRGTNGGEAEFNSIDRYHFGMKNEYDLAAGPGADELAIAKLVSFHHNTLTNMGHPTLDVLPGPVGSGSYGIRMSGTNCEEYENTITGLYDATQPIPNRLVFGVWLNQTNVTGVVAKSRGGTIATAQYGVAHNSSTSDNIATVKGKKIRDISFTGITLQAGGVAERNNIGRCGSFGINLQIADNTYVRKNYIFNTIQNGGAGGAIYQEQLASDPSLGYWEVTDNDISNVNGGSGVGFSSVAGSFNSTSFKYTEGNVTGVSFVTGAEYVSDIKRGTGIKAVGNINPQTLTVTLGDNIKDVVNIDATTIQVNFKKPIPTANYPFDARNANDVSVLWIGYGATTTYIRLRSVDINNAPVNLPNNLMLTVL